MTMTAAVMTQKQRAAIEAWEAARKQGRSLTQYAREHGLNVQRIHAMLSDLRKRGLLPKSGRKQSGRFLAVRVQAQSASAPAGLGDPGVVCRLIHSNRHVIECLHWPPPNWLSALNQGSADAAT